MTTLQKTVITATLAIVAGAGIYEARQAAKLRNEVQKIQQERAQLSEQIDRFQSERQKLVGVHPDPSANEALVRESEAHKAEKTKLLVLRNQANMIRSENERRTLAKDMERARNVAMQQLQWTNNSPMKSFPLNGRLELDTINAIGTAMPEDVLQSYLSVVLRNDYDDWLKLQFTPEYLYGFAESMTNSALPENLAKEREAIVSAKSVLMRNIQTYGESEASVQFNFEYGENRPANAPNGGRLMVKKISDDWKVIAGGLLYDYSGNKNSKQK